MNEENITPTPAQNDAALNNDTNANKPQPTITVIGVGGGGGNLIASLCHAGIQGVNIIACNSEDQPLRQNPAPTKWYFPNPEAEKTGQKGPFDTSLYAPVIRRRLPKESKVIVVIVGLGGFTGSFLAPTIARVAHEAYADLPEEERPLVVGLATMPFTFEGTKRCQIAQQGLQELKEHTDAIMVINNDQLRKKGMPGIAMGFKMADEMMLSTVQAFASILQNDNIVAIDFNDLANSMRHSGTMCVGVGSESGDNRALQTLNKLRQSPLFDADTFRKAKNVILTVTSSSQQEATFDEITEITDLLYGLLNQGDDFNIIWAAATDESIGRGLQITLIGCGCDD